MYYGPVPPLLALDRLKVSFPTRDGQGLLPAVREFSLTLAAGEVLGLVGESGSGKSATSLAIMRLLPTEARVEGDPREEDLDKIRHGIFLEGRRSAPARIMVLRRSHRHTSLKVEIHEGRKREIRKLFEAVGFPVDALRRVDFAGLTLEGLKPGQWRYLKTAEIQRLKKLVGSGTSR